MGAAGVLARSDEAWLESRFQEEVVELVSVSNFVPGTRLVSSPATKYSYCVSMFRVMGKYVDDRPVASSTAALQAKKVCWVLVLGLWRVVSPRLPSSGV